MKAKLAIAIAAALAAGACGPPAAQNATLPPKPLAASPSERVIGQAPAPSDGETETPVEPRAR